MLQGINLAGPSVAGFGHRWAKQGEWDNQLCSAAGCWPNHGGGNIGPTTQFTPPNMPGLY